MGNTNVSLAVPQDFEYFGVQMIRGDLFRLIMAPQFIVELSANTISQNWTIKEVRNNSGLSEIKLSGFPWHTFGSEDMSVKYFICALLQRYMELGWFLKTSSDLSRSDSDCSVLIFEKRASTTSPSVICLSMHHTDRLRVLAPSPVLDLMRTVLMNSWPKGISSEKVLKNGHEFKLHGFPWAWEASDTNFAMNEVLGALFANGWSFLGAIKSNQGSTAQNALYFRSMGQEEVSEQDKASSQFFGISLKRHDKIRFHKAPGQVVEMMRSYLPSFWSQGIQDEKTKPELYSHEFKLSGYPWQSHGSDAVASRALLNNTFNLLAKCGWDLYATFDTTNDNIKKSSFFFRYVQPKENPYNFCFSLNGWDRFRVINGDSTIIDSVRAGLIDGWTKGIREEQNYYSSWEFKLNGSPFISTSSTDDRIYVCVMMMLIFQRLKVFGFRIISSADTNSKHNDKQNHSVDLHTLFLSN